MYLKCFLPTPYPLALCIRTHQKKFEKLRTIILWWPAILILRGKSQNCTEWSNLFNLLIATLPVDTHQSHIDIWPYMAICEKWEPKHFAGIFSFVFFSDFPLKIKMAGQAGVLLKMCYFKKLGRIFCLKLNIGNYYRYWWFSKYW